MDGLWKKWGGGIGIPFREMARSLCKAVLGRPCTIELSVGPGVLVEDGVCVFEDLFEDGGEFWVKIGDRGFLERRLVFGMKEADVNGYSTFNSRMCHGVNESEILLCRWIIGC